jgi:membrane protein
MRTLPALGEVWSRLRAIVKGVGRQWGEHPILLLASGISFHAILCLIPLVVLGTALLGMVLNSSAEAVNRIHETITATFPQNPYSGKIQKTFHDLLADIIRYRRSFGWFGFITLLWTSSSLLDAVRTALNTVFHLRGTDSFLRGNVKNLILTVVLTLLFVLANVTTWLFILAGSLLERWEILGKGDVRSILPVVILVCSNVPVFLMFYILYRFVPGRGGIQPKAALAGSATASAIWWLSGIAFGWYLTSFGAGSLYGTYAFLMVSLLWIYYSSTAFMIGALVSQEYRLHKERFG